MTNLQTANQLLATARRNHTPAIELRQRQAAELKLPKITAVPDPIQPPANKEITPEQVQELRMRLGIPSLKDLNADHIDAEQEKELLRVALRAAFAWQREYRKQPGQGLLLSGTQFYSDVNGVMTPDPLRTGYGCGKTHMARSLAYSTVRMHWTGRVETSTMVSISKFFSARDAMAHFEDEGFTTSRMIPRDTPLVVIDDVGREGVLKFVKAELQQKETAARYFRIIDHCVVNSISLVLTTNLSSAELQEHIGGAAWSRLRQIMPKGNMVNMTGIRDFRPYQGGYR